MFGEKGGAGLWKLLKLQAIPTTDVHVRQLSGRRADLWLEIPPRVEGSTLGDGFRERTRRRRLYCANAVGLGAKRSIQKLQGQTFLPSRLGAKILCCGHIRVKLPSQPGNASRSRSGCLACMALPAQTTRNAELKDRNDSSMYCSPQKQRLVMTNFSG